MMMMIPVNPVNIPETFTATSLCLRFKHDKWKRKCTRWWINVSVILFYMNLTSSSWWFFSFSIRLQIIFSRNCLVSKCQKMVKNVTQSVNGSEPKSSIRSKTPQQNESVMRIVAELLINQRIIEPVVTMFWPSGSPQVRDGLPNRSSGYRSRTRAWMWSHRAQIKDTNWSRRGTTWTKNDHRRCMCIHTWEHL